MPPLPPSSLRPDHSPRAADARQLLHLASGGGAFFLRYWPGWMLALALAAGATLAGLVRRRQLRSLPDGPAVLVLHRPHETPWRSGATAYACGVGFAVLLFRAEAAFVGWLVLAVGDSFAVLVGSRWPLRPIGALSHRTGRQHRSLGGLIAFFAATLVALVAGLSWWRGSLGAVPLVAVFAAALAGALTEAFLPRVDDNLVLPSIGAATYLAVQALG